MKSRRDIRRMIKLLRLQRETIPEFSYFRDPNHTNIDKMIDSLEWGLDKSDWEIEDQCRLEGDGPKSVALGWCIRDCDPPVEKDDIWVKRTLGNRRSKL